MNSYKLFYSFLFILNFYILNAQISDKRLCVDDECSIPISKAKTLIRYASPAEHILSFPPNADVTVYSKSVGSKADLWGGEINGKRGYFPKNHIRETKVLAKPEKLVDTELKVASKEEFKVEPEPVQFEVVDGTTIYTDKIEPTVTQSPLQSSIVVESEPDSTTAPLNENEGILDQLSSLFSVSTNEDDEELDEDDFTLADDQTNGTQQVEGLSESANVILEPEKPIEVSNSDLTSEQVKEKLVETPQEIKTVPDGVLQPPIQSPPETGQDLGQNIESDNTYHISEKVGVEEIKQAENKVKTVDLPIIEEAVLNLTDSVQNLVEVLENKTPEAVLETVEVEKIVQVPETSIEKAEVPVAEEAVQNLTETIQNLVEVLENKTENLVKVEVPIIVQNSIETDNKTPENVLETVEVPVVDEPVQIVTKATANTLESSNKSIENIVIPVGVEEMKDEPKAEEPAPTLPPFSLFGHHQSPEVVSSHENVETEPLLPEIENVTEIVEEKLENFETPETIELEQKEVIHGDIPFDINEIEEILLQPEALEVDHVDRDHLISNIKQSEDSCSNENPTSIMDTLTTFNTNTLLYLITTSISVLIFLFGYFAIEKWKKEGPLVAKINNLEKELLVVLKENENWQNKISTESGYEEGNLAANIELENLKAELVEVEKVKLGLEDQVQGLEKELENSTEVGIELNRMLTELLSAESGSDGIKANVELFQRQLTEQQVTINTIQEALAASNFENGSLKEELDLSNRKLVEVQAEVDKLLKNLLKIEEEKDKQQVMLQAGMDDYKLKYQEMYHKFVQKEQDLNLELNNNRKQLEKTCRDLELKNKQFEELTETIRKLKSLKNNQIGDLLEVNSIKAELKLLLDEKKKYLAKIHNEETVKVELEKRAKDAIEECETLRIKYEEADKIKTETETKLVVLSNYFKDKEAQLQKELTKHESMWMERQGEASSTTERIKFMQEQLNNYKEQTESLKQEIMNQEVDLKSQISVLEKRGHENWLATRQTERKLEDAKQEAAQLRHRLTLRERSLQDDKPHRIFSPIDQNGDHSLDSPASPPLLYTSRDHISKSPPLPFLPPPPPPGVPFMPPPMHHGGPFMPPLPFPGDHRPPPLGRMSSPPLNARYSPSSRYSYDSSPSDSEYGASPPQRRGFGSFGGRRSETRRKGSSGGSNGSSERVGNSRNSKV